MLKYKNPRIEKVGKSATKTKVTATCFCGKEFDTVLSQIKTGRTKSCGCSRGEKHGMTGTRQHNIWLGIKYRCENPSAKHYKNYGGRGIKVCDRWKNSFTNFWDDMKEDYKNNLSIDRIDNDGNYCKENCRWANVTQQRRNMSSNVTYKEECATEASERLGGHKALVLDRIYRGWPKERAFTQPVRKTKK